MNKTEACKGNMEGLKAKEVESEWIIVTVLIYRENFFASLNV
ncbi:MULTISPECIES: hypothetical protein [Metabacillus]|nr:MULTISPECIES: hypothetical protein [Metabacillus]